MSEIGVQFFNRYTSQIETESIYGEYWLKFSLYNPFGKLGLHTMVKRGCFAHWYGSRMSSSKSKDRIKPFIEKFGINEKENLKEVSQYTSFNDFFYRKLKPEARPVDGTEDSVVFPADGRHLGFAKASEVEGVFVKGQKFNLERLLGNSDLSARYADGAVVFSRLCPVDYHRFHFPIAGVPGNTRLINGYLCSVSPLALRDRLGILWENKRYVTEIETERWGRVLMLEIGATNVGSVNFTYVPTRSVKKGEEKGYFAFGGSATFTIFEPSRVKLADDLLEQSAERRELYAKMGDYMGAFTSR